MGMSASQARLLSITTRLTNNEFRAQTITNSKTRLAAKTDEASQKYMDALNSKQLMFMNYDDQGNATKISLTPAVIYKYEPLKNQYMLLNSSDKVLVTNQDANNFENTGSLLAFLDCYDLVYDGSADVNRQKRAEWEAKCQDITEKYNEDYAQYLIDYAEWKALHDQWEIDHAEWEADPGQEDDSLYTKFTDTVGTSNTAVEIGTASCYYRGLRGNSSCYLHLLNHILGYDGYAPTSNTYTTSIGINIETNASSGDMGYYITPTQKETMHDLSQNLENEKYKCDGADRFTPYYNSSTGKDVLEGNIIQEAIDAGRIPTDVDILMSDYIYDASKNECAGKKTLKQKAIDLYYLIKNNLVTDKDVMKELLINFTEGDLKMVSQKEEPKEPEEPIEPKLILPDPPEDEEGYLLVRDQNKAQWYTNLWYKMNNSVSANIVDPVDFDNNPHWADIPDDVKIEYRFTVANKNKDKYHTNYAILEDNLSTSTEWIEFALEHGIVSMQQATFTNPSDDNNKVAEMTSDGYTWKSIIYTNAPDIVTVDDEKAIAIAETKYKKEMNEIQAQDKKYDQDLKKLDTEHNALQTEYDSIKEIINKNVERSFKAFS